MLDTETAEYFYSLLANNFTETNSVRKKTLVLKKILTELLCALTKTSNQYFSSNFSRIVWISDAYKLRTELSICLKRLNSFITKVSRDKNYIISEQDFIKAVKITALLVQTASGVEIHPVIKNLKTALSGAHPKTSAKSFREDTKSILKAVITKKGEYLKESDNRDGYGKIEFSSANHEEAQLLLKGEWIEFVKLAWKGATVNLLNVRMTSHTPDTFETTFESMLVLEPDYLIDVTDISETFLHKGYNPYLYFLKKFTQGEKTMAVAIGNIVNHCFDELMNNAEVNFDDAFASALKSRPLQIFQVALEDSSSLVKLRSIAHQHFVSIKKVLKKLKWDYLSLEPTFISNTYGLQGRLDALLEYKDDLNRKDIIELKSGGPPEISYSVITPVGERIQTGIWNNHFAQAICYNMLLDSSFDNRTGSSLIFYSKDENYPLRNAPNIVHKKKEVVHNRNWIIALERGILAGRFSIFNDFTPAQIGNYPSFSRQDIEQFASFYRNSSDLERDYFTGFTKFIYKEIYAEKIGGYDTNRRGFSALWEDSLDDKIDSYVALNDLVLDIERSDLDNYHLYFKYPWKESQVSIFRKGDACILYPDENADSSRILKQQLLKVTIKEISSEEIYLSLRNKQVNQEFLKSRQKWVLEPDYIESNKKLFASLYKFLCAEGFKKELLLGLQRPRFKELCTVKESELTNRQNEILSRALSAEDYFLIQGPPGTGKTSFSLRFITKHLYNSTNDNILILAYTNRAVDEICSSLLKISPEFPFLRLGNKESSDLKEWMISHLAEDMKMNDLFEKVKATRVFVSTVTTIVYNPEILSLKKFGTAIIDEASQILEPQIIGLLTHVDRFIMIGDEKQLPAVVVQDAIGLDNVGNNLKSIGLYNFGSSLFERLLRNSIDKGWNESHAMLDMQARMHQSIQQYPSTKFYNGSLKIFPANQWQTSDDMIFAKDSEDKIEKMLGESRLIFIESPFEPHSKYHVAEAARVRKIIQTSFRCYGENFSPGSIGVISPFRAQCAEIIRILPSNLKKIITVDTVERFQGSERDMIIISYALNYQHLLGNVQSLAKVGGDLIDRKLNVAMTRARNHLIILGNPDILTKSEIFSELIEFIKNNGSYVEHKAFQDGNSFPGVDLM